MPLILRPPGIHSGLADHLANLGRTHKRVAITTGLLSLLGLLTGLTLLVCSLDACLSLHPLLRAVALVATLITVGLLWCTRLVTAIRMPTDPLGVALILEKCHASLNDCLASAVSFLLASPYDSRSAGWQLRSAAIRAAERQADRQDLSRMIPTARLWRSIWVFTALLAIAVPLTVWDPSRTIVALSRFTDPFGAHSWPPKTRIEILYPSPLPHRLPKGKPIDLRFAVRGEIPSHAVITLRLDSGAEFAESYPLVESDTRNAHHPSSTLQTITSPARSRGEREAFLSVRIPADRIPTSFQFRIRANDGDTGWQRVTVANPPRLVPHEGRPSPHLHITPPQYTGLVPYDLENGSEAIMIPVGSRVRFRAATDVRVTSASIGYLGPVPGFGVELSDEDSETPRATLEEHSPEILVGIASNGQTLEANFTPTQSGLYSLNLIDESGIRGNWYLKIRVDMDPQPIVTMHRPSPSKDPPVLVPTSNLTVQVAVEDKLYGFRRASLEYRVGLDGTVRSIPLADVERTWFVMPAISGPSGVIRPQPIRYEGSFTFPIETFLREDGTSVRDGDTLILWMIADDWDNVTPGKLPGRSEPVQIRIVSKLGAEAYVLEQLAPLRKEIRAARAQQQEARGKLIELNPAPDGTLSNADREKYLSIEPTQQQIRSRVAALRSQAERLRETVRINGLQDTPTGDRVMTIADGLDRLAERDLTAIGPMLAEGRQLSNSPLNTGDLKRGLESFGFPPSLIEKFTAMRGVEVRKVLARAEQTQREVEDGLTVLLDVLSIWGGASEIRGEARSLRDAILREAAVADRLPIRIPPGRPPVALTPDQRDELDRAVARLDSLVDRANQLITHTTRLAEQKERDAIEARDRAAKIEIEVESLQAQANSKPMDALKRDVLLRRAKVLSQEATDLRVAADRHRAEARALRQALADADQPPAEVESRNKAVIAVGGGWVMSLLNHNHPDGLLLVEELRQARRDLESNRPGEAARLERSAATRLDRMVVALTENELNATPDQTNRWKATADQLDGLAAEQFDLDRRIAEATQLPEPARRDALKALATEQQKLIDQGRALAFQLTKVRSDAAARDARDALDKMQAVRDDLEQGKSPGPAARQAVEKLDDARDKLDQAEANAPRIQATEQKRRLIERLTILRDEQKRVASEAARLQQKAAAAKGWDRDILSDFNDLNDRERVLATEVRLLASELQEYPVFARLLEDSAESMENASERIRSRVRGIIDSDPGANINMSREAAVDSRIRRPMDLATRRLDMVLTAMTEAPELPPNTAGVVPPIAQVKALQMLQTELNERTAVFDKTYPDRTQIDDFAREELKEIEDVQRALAALFSLKSVSELFVPKQSLAPRR